MNHFTSKSLFLAAMVLTLTAAAWAQTETILYSFTGGSDGGSPSAGLIFDGKGNLYGATSSGGANFDGAVFELTPNGNGTWSEQVLHSFTGFGPSGDGEAPWGRLTFDGKGNLYGTTEAGGPGYLGTVFELSPGSNGTWTNQVLHGFAGGSDGSLPYSGVTIDGAGNLYGTTYSGGTDGFGTVFELVAGTNGTWTEKILHTFTGEDDGSSPFAGVILDNAGRLYGMTSAGGAHDYGVVFQLIPESNGAWSQHIVHAFAGGNDGSGSYGALAFDRSGNLYVAGVYALLQLTPTANGPWTRKNIHSFVGGNDGASADGGLVFDKAGNLYGTTYSGGLHRGTVFELSPSSGGWTEKILHSFTGAPDGQFPSFGAPALDTKGNLYGTAPTGGASNAGVVFEITP
jgi:uncharacterized repeat protein (TIGR03803 family)